MTIYVWPPVGLKSRPVWTERAPIRRSRSLLTGARYVSAHERKRLHAEFSVSARRGNKGAGYMDVLARLVEGGEHLVRLYYKHPSVIAGRVQEVRWESSGGKVTWYDSSALSTTATWYTGTPGTGTPTVDEGFPAVDVTGLPASTLIAIPGEFVKIGSQTRMVIAEARSDADGKARIRIIEAFTTGVGICTVGEPETAVFEAVSIPEGGGPLSSDYTYDWIFEQVHPEEYGTQTEVGNWWT